MAARSLSNRSIFFLLCAYPGRGAHRLVRGDRDENAMLFSPEAVAGGGDTVSALANAGVDTKFTYVSTAGGAFLEWMEGKELPGVVIMKK